MGPAWSCLLAQGPSPPLPIQGLGGGPRSPSQPIPGRCFQLGSPPGLWLPWEGAPAWAMSSLREGPPVPPAHTSPPSTLPGSPRFWCWEEPRLCSLLLGRSSRAAAAPGQGLAGSGGMEAALSPPFPLHLLSLPFWVLKVQAWSWESERQSQGRLGQLIQRSVHSGPRCVCRQPLSLCFVVHKCAIRRVSPSTDTKSINVTSEVPDRGQHLLKPWSSL